MHVELQATCAALGYVEGSTYHKEPDCLETVKDLIRFLKREDESCDIRRQLGNAQILENDLLPLVKHHHSDRILLETVVRLLVNLTQPAKLCFQNQVPGDKTNRNFFLEVEGHLQASKEAFADEALFAVLTKKLGDLLQLDFEHRQEEDRLLIERILILLRNILHVPPNPTNEKRTDDDASVHDQVLWALHVSGMEDLLLYLSSADNEQGFALHVLEIISLMFREQTAEQLASAGGPRSVSERERDENELAMMRERERAEKKAKAFKLNSRHSRFGGTFTVANMKSISNEDLIYHRPVASAKNINFDHNKVPKKRPKNRRIITDKELTRRSTLSIRLFLKEFCVQFLENCYNPLMYSVKDTLVRARAQENDETYYLWAMRFFMQFNRHYNFRVDLVGETLSISAFHYIQTNLTNYHEMILTQKKEGIIWSRRMHLALRAYLELLHNLSVMDHSKDSKLQQSAKVLKGNVFYLMEYRDVFVMLLKKFDETRQSRIFLQDLVECTHLFTRMLEYHCKKNKHLVVQRAQKRPKKKNKKKNKPVEPTGPSAEQLEEQWDTASGELSAIFQGRGQVPDDVLPFDAASEVDEAQQRVEAMIRIQDYLRQGEGGQAVALIRSARSLWPEREEFGHVDISPEDEFMAMREIFFADLPRPQVVTQQPEEEEEEEEGNDGVEEEETEGMVENKEEEFNLPDFLRRFAAPQVVQAYITLLGEYRTLSPHGLHCAVKMLHRIAVDLCMTPMLFQARLFRVFQHILGDPGCRTKHFQELQGLAKYVVRKFFEVAADNNKAFVEIFFWKNQREATEMTEGYGSYKEHAKKVKSIWTEEQDEELKMLYESHKDAPLQGGDVLDNIMAEMIDQCKTRRQILKQLITLDLISSAKDLKPISQRAWLEHDILELRTLVDEHRNSENPMTHILAGMTKDRSRHKVMEKCVEMGFVGEKRELFKKRKGGGQRKRRRQDSSDDEMEEAGEHHHNREDPEHEDSAASGESTDSEADADDDLPLYIKHINKAVRHAVAAGIEEPALEWIRKCLSRTADDREEDDDDESIPLVPLLDEQEEAMDNQAFQAILKAAGIKPPANEQERFWRIPGNLTVADLRSRATALVMPSAEQLQKQASGKHKALKDLAKKKKSQKNGNTKKAAQKKPAEGPIVYKSREWLSSASESSDSENENGKRLTIATDQVSRNQASPSSSTSGSKASSRSRTQSNRSPSPSGSKASSASNCSSSPSGSRSSFRSMTQSTVGNTSDNDASSTQQSKRSRSVLSEDSDDGGGVSSQHSKRSRHNSDTEEDNSRKNSGRRACLASDSEDETQPEAAESKNKAAAEPESFPATMFTQNFGSDDSDSDVDDHVPLKRAAHRPAIESDSD